MTTTSTLMEKEATLTPLVILPHQASKADGTRLGASPCDLAETHIWSGQKGTRRIVTQPS
jgi:hypothetical protein